VEIVRTSISRQIHSRRGHRRCHVKQFVLGFMHTDKCKLSRTSAHGFLALLSHISKPFDVELTRIVAMLNHNLATSRSPFNCTFCQPPTLHKERIKARPYDSAPASLQTSDPGMIGYSVPKLSWVGTCLAPNLLPSHQPNLLYSKIKRYYIYIYI
jgi:hypothetical protein